MTGLDQHDPFDMTQINNQRPKRELIQLIFIMIATLLIAGFSSYILKTDRVYTHFFYIPIAICAARYPKYTLHMGLFFSGFHLILELLLRGSFGMIAINRVVIIMSVAFLLKSIWEKEKAYLQKINQLDHASNHDCMTEVLNRRGLELLIKENQISFPATLIMCDLDGLKNINDHFGHSTGDAFIKETASILRLSTRQGDIVSRIGGDEFLLVLQKCSKDVANQVILRIESGQAAFNNQNQISQTSLPRLSIACGYAEALEESHWEGALKESDEAMYANKMQHYKTKRRNEDEENYSAPLV